jgi:hypothetical protein
MFTSVSEQWEIVNHTSNMVNKLVQKGNDIETGRIKYGVNPTIPQGGSSIKDFVNLKIFSLRINR